jgi:hypothetical protein
LPPALPRSDPGRLTNERMRKCLLKVPRRDRLRRVQIRLIGVNRKRRGVLLSRTSYRVAQLGSGPQGDIAVSMPAVLVPNYAAVPRSDVATKKAGAGRAGLAANVRQLTDLRTRVERRSPRRLSRKGQRRITRCGDELRERSGSPAGGWRSGGCCCNSALAGSTSAASGLSWAVQHQATLARHHL